MKTRIGTVAALLVAASLGMSGVAMATMDIQKKAKAAGYEATSCQYCHVDKLPKKEAHEMNDRGKWLVEQKTKKSAKEVDVTWLKEYVEKK